MARAASNPPLNTPSLLSQRSELVLSLAMLGVHHPNAIAELRATLVIPYTSTARPYRPRRPSTS
jgi:hypothetical protein